MGRLFAFEIAYRGIFQKTLPSTSVAPPDARRSLWFCLLTPRSFSELKSRSTYRALVAEILPPGFCFSKVTAILPEVG